MKEKERNCGNSSMFFITIYSSGGYENTSENYKVLLEFRKSRMEKRE